MEKCAAAAATCACFNLRKASRAVTQHFDEALQPSGLRSTQLVVLLAVALYEGISPARLAREMIMDRSTLLRNLRPLESRGLLQTTAGKDRRSRAVRLTPLGKKTLIQTIPLWEAAQERFENNVGPERWRRLVNDLAETVAATRGAGVGAADDE